MHIAQPLRNIVLYLALLLVPAVASAQIEYHEILVNDSLHYNFESVANAPQVEIEPVNGDYIFNGLENYPLGQIGDNELIYIPNTDYLGPDTIQILFYVDGITGPSQRVVTLAINVVEAYVMAINDFASTSLNTPTTIDVLGNDMGPGELSIRNIPLTNHGTAAIVNGNIDFTPSSTFKGRANLTYTVCDEANNICDVATITVFVQENLSVNDSTTIVIQKNNQARALFPTNDGIQELESPNHGTLNLMDGGLKYTPDQDYVGKDTFTYAYNINTTTSLATFVIDVLWAADPNTMVVNDHANTAINDSTEFNVLDNDLNTGLSILTYTQSDEGGLVEHLGDGEFKYIPPNSFNGLDFFEYTANISGTSAEETGVVYIVVSNRLPSNDDYTLYTPKNTPIVIDYDIPITNFDFEIISQGQFGEVVYHPGYVNIEVNGQDVEGYNVLVYSPYDSYVGADVFEIEYCVGDDCKQVIVNAEILEITNPQADTLCVTDCVWPGDTNRDGVVNMSDVLPLGYCVGEVGPSRDNGSTEFYGQFASNWDGEMGPAGVNIKHVDANGDGYVSDLDTAAIHLSYGMSSQLTPSPVPTNTQIPLFFVPRTQNPGPGDKVIIDIVLGTENLPAIDIHGITFALNFNEDIVEEGTMVVEYASENWLAYESTMMSMVEEPYLGRVESGYTRATGISKNGYGILGQVSFIVVDDIIDGSRLRDTLTRTFRPEAVLSMNAAGEYMSLASQNFDLRIAHQIDEPFENDNRNLIAYPNPTTGVLNIFVNGKNELEQVIVHSLTGQEVYRTTDELSGKQTNIVLNEKVATGIYLVTAICDRGVFTQKVKLVR